MYGSKGRGRVMKKMYQSVVCVLCMAGLQLLDDGRRVQADTTPIDIQVGWVRAVPPVARNTAAYMRIVNNAHADDVLLRVETPFAEIAEIHEVIREGGVAHMQALRELKVPAKDHVVLAPGGVHLMLMKTSPDFAGAESVPLRFVFKIAGALDVDLPVLNVSSDAQDTQKTSDQEHTVSGHTTGE